jgi:hypothetical protein
MVTPVKGALKKVVHTDNNDIFVCLPSHMTHNLEDIARLHKTIHWKRLEGSSSVEVGLSAFRGECYIRTLLTLMYDL